MDKRLTELLERYRPLLLAEMSATLEDEALASADVRPLYGWMRYHLGWENRAGASIDTRSAGKLLRPLAVLLTSEACDGEVAQAMPAAAAVELIHNFSLLHDDIEDGSERRRGRQTVWTFAGTPQAINTGDGVYALARLAMHRLVDCDVDAPDAINAMRELDRACLRLVEGQYLDISFEDRSGVTTAEYLAMTRGKTAALFAASFAIGAQLAGSAATTIDSFRAFGLRVGIAFQAIDDILGIWGDPETTGKPVGDDLRTRKITYPVVHAFADDGPAGRLVASAYSSVDKSTDDSKVAELSEAIAQAGGRAATEDLASTQLHEARSFLDEIGGLSEQHRQMLEAFADASAERIA